MKLSTLAKFGKNSKRLREVVAVLAKYGLAHWFREKDPQFIKESLKSSAGEPISDLPEEVRIRMALTELGTTFIKLGQVLSTREDLIGPTIAQELAKLQADVPADDGETVRRTVEAELGQPLEELFAEFDLQPLGSASVGQVHRARLFSGEHVVVKVQHYNIEPIIQDDLEILRVLAEAVEHYSPALRLYQPRLTVADFSRNLKRELDYRREIRSLNKFQQNFTDNKWVCIPKTYPELSSRRVLTMEMFEGYSIANSERMDKDGIDKKDFVRRGAKMYLDMVFRDRFFHADPHPGNLWVLKDGQLGLLDFGMTGRLDSEMREDLEGMLLAAVDDDAERLVDHVLRIATVPSAVDRNLLKREIDDFLSEYVNVPIDELDLSAALNSLTSILRNHHILLPSGISLIIRLLVMLEGTSRSLDRSFSLTALIQPYAAKSVRRRYRPKKLLQQARYTYRDWDRVLKALPRDLNEVLTRAREGRLDVSIEHRRIEKVSTWIVHGILSASLIMGGSMILSQSVPPSIQGISLLGGVVSGTGFILGSKLLRSMKNSGKV